jgi:hypothetical protein
MKYVKLFESWINEAEKIEVPKDLSSILKIDGISGPGLYNPMKEIKVSDNVILTYDVQLLDTNNPSNKNVSSGITINGRLQGNTQGKSASTGGRWTLNPLGLIEMTNKKDEAASLKNKIETSIKSMNEKYGIPISYEGYKFAYKGKFVDYYSGEGQDNDFTNKAIKKSLSEEEISDLKVSLDKGLKEITDLLEEIEKTGASIFATEIKLGAPLPTGMKLLGAFPKDGIGGTINPSDTAGWLKRYKNDLSNKKWIGARLAVMSGIAGAIAYAYAKCSVIEKMANDPKIMLAINATYGNTDNKFASEIYNDWEKVKNIAKSLGAKEQEIERYAPKKATQKQ